MSKRKPLRKQNVISLRISDSELESLHEIMEMTQMRVTEVLREAIRLISPSAPGRSRSLPRRQKHRQPHESA
ncbi:MAG TPA: hypothetical protein VI298_03725 [Geobacteraceae bacterium]